MLRLPKCLRALTAVSLLFGSSAQAQEPKAGQIVVASGSSQDPDFARAVVLLIRSDRGGAAGLVLNRPSSVTLIRLFPELKGGDTATDPVYLGGPLGKEPVALARSRAPEKSLELFEGVYAISDHTILEKLALERRTSKQFRLFVGYAGWSSAQLKNEISRGLWEVREGDARIVFDPRPGTLWKRLNPVYRPPL